MAERINEKLLANIPKEEKLGGDGILRHNGKEYVARSMDIAGNKVIYEQIINSKGTGNFKMMQGGRFVSTGKPVQIIKGVNYKFGNFVYDPKTWAYGIALEEIVNGYLSPEPPTNGWQAIGGGINKIVEMYNK
jgi:haemagglutination activity domain protein